ncbi:hypothetical protein OW763_05370 [Clostridium aestuarii]|uniref:Uncharacterized protein n=1 Tax=Clostridium aestuarii TaxID=338193 RepID=A0ABT4CXR4_9CLOT|nr:hypothetical protein [Clostridium aestuarii]MCY6483779.1 hypothetical protein [Clostridium aestuarii]
MRLVINYKSGKKEMLNEEDTKKVMKSINYLKLIRFIMSSKKLKGKTINILDKKINIDELKSLEILFM